MKKITRLSEIQVLFTVEKGRNETLCPFSIGEKKEKNDFMDYSSAKWKKKRAKILRLDGYKDVVAGWYGRTCEAQMVHHIYPAEEYPEYAWEDWNLISVSYSTHKKLENHMTGGLTELGKQLMRSTTPYVDWRKKK